MMSSHAFDALSARAITPAPTEDFRPIISCNLARVTPGLPRFLWYQSR